MNRQDLMTQAKKIMTTYACRDLDGEMRVEMQGLVGNFFDEHVSNLEQSEIMDHMTTPMKALDWFNAYLCEAWMRRCLVGAASDSADTCQLA